MPTSARRTCTAPLAKAMSLRSQCAHWLWQSVPQSLPCLKGGGPAAGWWRDLCGEESPSHGFAVPAPFRQGAINLSDASRPSPYRISQRACCKNIFYQLSFIPNRIDCSFSFQRLSVWMTSSSVSVFGRICKMENWKNLYRSGCAQITSFISLLCPCSEST